MTRDGHPYLPKGLKFKAGNFGGTSVPLVLECPGRSSVPLEGLEFKVYSLYGTDEHPARPRMTETVIRTFRRA